MSSVPRREFEMLVALVVLFFAVLAALEAFHAIVYGDPMISTGGNADRWVDRLLGGICFAMISAVLTIIGISLLRAIAPRIPSRGGGGLK